jgi:hypothetical protein
MRIIKFYKSKQKLNICEFCQATDHTTLNPCYWDPIINLQKQTTTH